jgi:hypothetical protein
MAFSPKKGDRMPGRMVKQLRDPPPQRQANMAVHFPDEGPKSMQISGAPYVWLYLSDYEY